MPRLSKKELAERDERVKEKIKRGWSLESIMESEGLKSPNKLKGAYSYERRKLEETQA